MSIFNPEDRIDFPSTKSLFDFDLKHKVTVIKGKRLMTCVGHFCDIDSMPEGEYYKKKREQQKEKSVKQ